MSISNIYFNKYVPDIYMDTSIPISLEKEFENQGVFDIDLDKGCNFEDYLSPNEGNPQSIIPHLRAAQEFPGIPVCTGTERLFFLLLFSNVVTCQGMVGRDINPKVKAYVDFNTALLRISKTVQEYEKLSSYIRNKDENLLRERINVIKRKIELSDLDEKVKRYYLENIYRFGEIYLTTDKNWREEDSDLYKYCWYDRDKELFSKLKHYADSGNIICTVGSIDDLAFLKNRKITIIDTSNIKTYSCLDFKGGGDFHPRIIWTIQDPKYTTYYSSIFKSLSERERIEFDGLLNKVYASGIKPEQMHIFLCNKVGPAKKCTDPLNYSIITVFSVETLDALRVYVNNNFLRVPRLGFVDMLWGGMENLNTLSIEEIDEMCRDPETQRFLIHLIRKWNILDPRVYLALSKTKGWKEAFEDYFLKGVHNLNGCLNHLKEHQLLEGFVLEFGQERLDRLLAKVT